MGDWPSVEHATRVGLQASEIADIVFPHNMDSGRRERLALALVKFARLVRDAQTQEPQS